MLVVRPSPPGYWRRATVQPATCSKPQIVADAVGRVRLGCRATWRASRATAAVRSRGAAGSSAIGSGPLIATTPANRLGSFQATRRAIVPPLPWPTRKMRFG